MGVRALQRSAARAASPGYPTATGDGRRAPAIRFGDPRAQALAGTLANHLSAVAPITNTSLRASMAGLLGTPYSRNQAGYDLARLRANGLLTRVPGRNQYTPTPDGIQFAVFYTKVHDRVLRPLFTSTEPHAPPDVRAALRTLDAAVAHRLADARMPAVA